MSELVLRGLRTREFVEAVLSQQTEQHSLKVGQLDVWAANQISSLLGFVIDPTDEYVLSDSVIHACKRHPNLRLVDWEYLPWVTNQFDQVARGQKARNPELIRLIMRKTNDSDVYGVVVELAGVSHQRKRLNLVSFFKGTTQSIDAWWYTNLEKNKGVGSISVSTCTKLVQKTPDALPTPSRLRITQTALFDRFAAIAVAHASKTALIFKNECITYAVLLDRVNAKATQLEASWGLGSGARIPYVGLNDPEQLATLLACAKVEAMFLPVNYRLAQAEIETIYADAGVLSHATNPPALRVDPPTSQGGTNTLDTAVNLPLRSRGNVPQGQRGLAPSQPCLLVYTSGTTGKPKGALHTQAGLLANARAAWVAHDMTRDDMILSTLPLFHVGGLCIQTLPALLLGATVVLHDRFDASAWLEAVQQHKPTLSLCVPATMKVITESPMFARTDLSSLRGIMAGSSTVPLHLIERFHARGIPVGQIYGATETGPVSAVLPFAKAISHAGLAGWPHDECKIELHNQNAHGVGEVVIRATNLMMGYWSDTNWGQTLINCESFNTGDLGRIRTDGCLEIVGRAKDMLISGGENIYPAEIENALLACEAIEECAVVGIPDAEWGEIPVAYIVWKNGLVRLSDGVLQNFLKARIAKFKLPKRYVTIQALPKSALGKVLKTELMSAYKI